MRRELWRPAAAAERLQHSGVEFCSSTHSAESSKVCCHFLEGRCAHGMKCSWQHPGSMKARRCRFGSQCQIGHGQRQQELGCRSRLLAECEQRPPLHKSNRDGGGKGGGSREVKRSSRSTKDSSGSSDSASLSSMQTSGSGSRSVVDSGGGGLVGTARKTRRRANASGSGSHCNGISTSGGTSINSAPSSGGLQSEKETSARSSSSSLGRRARWEPWKASVMESQPTGRARGMQSRLPSVDIPMEERRACCHFLQGSCSHGSSCWWRHPADVTESTVCRFGGACPLLHGKTPKQTLRRGPHASSYAASDGKEATVPVRLAALALRAALRGSTKVPEIHTDETLTSPPSSGVNSPILQGEPEGENQEYQDPSSVNDQDRENDVQAPQLVCCFFSQGRCTYGAECSWSHTPPDQCSFAPRLTCCNFGAKCHHGHGLKQPKDSATRPQLVLQRAIAKAPPCAEPRSTPPRWPTKEVASEALRLLCGMWLSSTRPLEGGQSDGKQMRHEVRLELAPGSRDCAALTCLSGEDRPNKGGRRLPLDYLGGHILLGGNSGLALESVSEAHAVWISRCRLDLPPWIWSKEPPSWQPAAFWR